MLLKIAKHIILLICLISTFSCKFLDSETIPLTENCKDYFQVLQDSIQIDGKKIYMYRIDSTDCNLFVRYDTKKTNLAAIKQFLNRNQYLRLDSTLQDSIFMDTVISELEVTEEVQKPVEVTPQPPVEEVEIDSSKIHEVAKDSISKDSSKLDSSKKKKKKEGFLGLF